MRGRAAASIAVLIGLIMLTACTATPSPPSSDPRPVTAAESELLAASRFRNFDAGTRTVSFQVDEDGTPLRFDGWFDYATGTGYGALTADGRPNTLLLWDASVVAAHAPAPPDASTPAPLPIPDATPLGSTWTSAPLSAAHSRLHNLLQVITSLGSDRPDNPLLVRQGGALALGADDIDGTPVDVFAGPLSDSPLPEGQSVDPEASSTRFWLDSGGVMQRAAVRLGGSGAWQDIDFGAADGVDLGEPLGGGSNR
ncbi:hypothetical protein [Microbacterium testaceum]|uniref:hypothetical protein n=1 Tax=Microbacterium testaceum TaxID=2033 RepID=UPI0037F828B5